jgi:hypothetical protein
MFLFPNPTGHAMIGLSVLEPLFMQNPMVSFLLWLYLLKIGVIPCKECFIKIMVMILW